MKVTPTKLEGVLIVEPAVFGDERGYFLETYNMPRYADAGIGGAFVQDNLSCSATGVLRGLHFQNPHTQGKLVSVLRGEVFDVAVDIRSGSPTFGQWVGVTLSGENKLQLYIPEGFAHGFYTMRDDTLFAYKCTGIYHPESELTIIWDDPDIGIAWPAASPIVSAKDLAGRPLKEVGTDRLPSYRPPKSGN